MAQKKNGYRLNAGVVLFRPDGQVWYGHRIPENVPGWQFPQGGIDEGETPEQAAVRELKEETGTDKARIFWEVDDWLSYDFPPDLKARMAKKHIGQSQKWFGMLFEGDDNDINIDTDHPEFDQWRWGDLEDAPGHIIDWKRPVYERLVEDLIYARDLIRMGRPYRPCVGLALFNKQGQVFMGHRLDETKVWQLPQGGIDPGEDPSTTAMRELAEEVGTTKARIIDEISGWTDYPCDSTPALDRFRVLYGGYHQKWYAALYEGDDDAINIKTAQPEFDDWKWVDLEDVTRGARPFIAPVYKAVVDAFTPLRDRIRDGQGV